MTNDVIDLEGGGSNLPPISGLKKKDVINVLSEINESVDFTGACVQYNVCHLPFISPESWGFFEVYRACAGVSRLRRPDEFYNLSALYVQICRVIDNELADIAKEKRTAE